MIAHLTRRAALLLAGLFLVAAGCAPSLEQREINAADAIKALQDGAFEDAAEEAEGVLASDPENPYAGIVLAVTTYEEAMSDLLSDIPTVVLGTVATGNFNQHYLEHALTEAADALEKVDRLLRPASEEPRIAMELCPACWELDLGGGDMEVFDEDIMEVAEDRDGRPLHPQDPRRRPTFRFDHGDVLWARAFVSFQRAVAELALAYDWKDVELMFEGGLLGSGGRGEPPERLRFKLRSKERVHEARDLILAGLDLSDRARLAFLAENDDDREWVPNPVQEDHPIPLPVDRKLYDTWATVLDDLEALVRGEHVLYVSDLIELAEPDTDDLPRGALDLAAMLDRPKDITVELDTLEKIDDAGDDSDAKAFDDALKELLGEYYLLDTERPASPLPSRLDRMKRDLMEGRETMPRKLRYLFWLN